MCVCGDDHEGLTSKDYLGTSLKDHVTMMIA